MLLAISLRQGFAQDDKGLTIGYSANYLIGIKNKDLTSFKNGYNSALGNQLEQPFHQSSLPISHNNTATYWLSQGLGFMLAYNLYKFKE